MDKELYSEIIKEYLFPMVGSLYAYKAKIHQDNDPKHTSKHCQQTFEDLNLTWVMRKNRH